MNDFFSDYRISSWMENGVLKGVESAVKPVRVAVAAMALGAALCFSATASNLDYVSDSGFPSGYAVAQVEAQISQHPAMVKIRELNVMFDERLAKLDSSDHSDIDPDLLAMASNAIVAIDARKRS